MKRKYKAQRTSNKQKKVPHYDFLQIIFIIATVVLISFLIFWPTVKIPEDNFFDIRDQNLIVVGKKVYAQHCVACHVINLDSKASLLNGMTHARSISAASNHTNAELFQIVKNGLNHSHHGKDTKMPAFRKFLSDNEIIAVVTYMRSTWARK